MPCAVGAVAVPVRLGAHREGVLGRRAGQVFIGMDRKVNDYQSTSLIGETANGTYRLLAPAVTFSLGHRF